MSDEAYFRKQVEAAVALQGLRKWKEADDELEKLAPEHKSDPFVLNIRCLIYLGAGRWDMIEQIAGDAAATHPDDGGFVAKCAWAKYRQGKTEEALSFVLDAAGRLPASAAVAYMVACLNGALNRIPEANAWLLKAFDLADDPEKMKEQASKQTELAAVWPGGNSFAA